MKKILGIATIMLSSIALFSCGLSDEKSIIVGTTSKIEHANVTDYAFEMLSSGVSNLPLVREDTEGNFYPLVANYSTTDAKTWTYKIENGMKWSDGEDVTVYDILFSMEYEDKEGANYFKDILDEDGNVITKKKYTSYSISADEKEISLTLSSANVRDLSNMLSFRIKPKHIYENKKSLTEADYSVACGPYVLESFNKDSQSLTFVKNKYYPYEVKATKVIYQMFSSLDTLYTALNKNDIDFAWDYSTGIQSTYLDAIDKSSVNFISVPSTNAPAVLAFNNSVGLFSSLDIRNAVSYALDYEEFKTYFGSEYSKVPNRGFVPETTIGFVETSKNETNIDKALECLKNAGYSKKNSAGYLVDNNGNVLTFKLTVNSTKAAHIRYAELVKTNLTNVGFNVILDSIDTTAFNAKTSNKFSNNNITFEAAIFGYTAFGMSSGAGLASIYVDGSHSVQGGCQVYDEEFSTIINDMSNASTLESYYSNASKLQSYYEENVPFIALYWDNQVFGYSNKISNVYVDYTFGLNNAKIWEVINK